MAKTKSYDEWVDEYPGYHVFRKESWIYRTRDESAELLHSMGNYQLIEREGRNTAGSHYLENLTRDLKKYNMPYVIIHYNEVVDLSRVSLRTAGIFIGHIMDFPFDTATPTLINKSYLLGIFHSRRLPTLTETHFRW